MSQDKTSIQFEQKIPEEILGTVKAEAENKQHEIIKELENFVSETSKLHAIQPGKSS